MYWKIPRPPRGGGEYQPMSFGGKYEKGKRKRGKMKKKKGKEKGRKGKEKRRTGK
jgi:hypothetical protein